MSLKQISYFCTVAEAGSFTAAARVLHVSQPALGLQVKQLEEHLGMALFQRHSRGVELTQAGQIFFSHAKQALEAIAHGERALVALKRPEVREFSLGLTPTSGRALVADMLTEFSEKAANVKFALREGLTDDLWQAVSTGELDAALCYEPPESESATRHDLYEEDLVLVGAPHLIGASGTSVAIGELEAFPLLLGDPLHRTRSFIERFARDHGVDLTTAVEVEPISMKREMVLRHGRCSIVPQGLFFDEIRTGQLVLRPIRPAMTRTVALVINRKVSRDLAGFVIDLVERMVERCAQERNFGWRPVACAAHDQPRAQKMAAREVFVPAGASR